MSLDNIQEIATPPRSDGHKTHWCILEVNFCLKCWLSRYTFQLIGFFPNAIIASFARLKHRDVRNGDADFVAPSGLGYDK